MMKLSLFEPINLIIKEIKELSNPGNSQEKLILNGMRGISVLMIVFFHSLYAVLYLLKDNLNALYGFINQVPGCFSFVYSFDKAVDIFFILSAYLLGSQLFHEINNTNKIILKKFYIRRFFRIYPLFIIALAFYSLSYIDDLYPRIIHNLIFIDNILHKNTINPGGWSLAIEAQFYVILPFIILFSNKLGKHTLLFLVFLLVGSILIRHFILLSNPNFHAITSIDFLENQKLSEEYMKSVYFPTYSRFSTLVLGLIWAYIYQFPRYLNVLKKQSIYLGTFIFIIALSMILLSMQVPSYDRHSWFNKYIYPDMNIWILTLHRVLFGVSIIITFILIDLKLLPIKIGKLLNAIFSSNFLRLFAQLSFPVFLFHVPFVIVAYSIVFRTMDINSIQSFPLWQVLLCFPLALILTLLFSIILHRFIEKPFINKGKIISQSIKHP